MPSSSASLSFEPVDILVVGSGPAGYTAAIYGARAGYRTALLTGLQPGGQLTLTEDIENFPGFPEPVGGTWLMERMREQAANVQAEIIDDSAEHCDLKREPAHENRFIVKTDGGRVFGAHTIIVATGAQAKWLGIESETRLRGQGVSTCATCDGFFYRKKPVAVIGGGNTAVEEALYLSKIASRVYLVHRRDTLKAEHILRERLKKTDNITFVPDVTLEEILASGNPEGVCGIKLADKNGNTRIIDVDGVFVAIGHAPNLGPFKGLIATDEYGYVRTFKGMETSVAGVFAAGDIQDSVYRQAVTAAGSGCKAALDAQRYLESTL